MLVGHDISELFTKVFIEIHESRVLERNRPNWAAAGASIVVSVNRVVGAAFQLTGPTLAAWLTEKANFGQNGKLQRVSRRIRHVNKEN